SDSADRSEPGDWRPTRRQADSPSQRRDIPSNLYELRCVGCRVRTGWIDSNAAARWRKRRLLRLLLRCRIRRVAAVPVLLRVPRAGDRHLQRLDYCRDAARVTHWSKVTA